MLQNLNRQSRLITLILTAALGLGAGAALAAEGAVQKVASTSDGYCHLKIPAARTSTWSNDKPELKSSNTGDVIDFYGPCDVDPTSKDLISSQRSLRSYKYGKF